MLRSTFAAFLGAFIAGATIDTVRERVLDTFYPAPPGVAFATVVGLALAIAVLFLLVQACRDAKHYDFKDCAVFHDRDVALVPVRVEDAGASHLVRADFTQTGGRARPRASMPEYGHLG